MTLGQMNLLQVKKLFLDKAAVTRRLDAEALKLLRTVGGRTRLRARSSIRNAPKKRRKGGRRAPYNRTGLLKRFIFFALDPQADSVVTGPIKLDSTSGDVPALLEFGGVQMVKGERASYDPFPFMGPAHDSTMAAVPGMLKDMIK